MDWFSPRDMLITERFWRDLETMSLTAQLNPLRMTVVVEEEPWKTC
jgi:hypothetical protein